MPAPSGGENNILANSPCNGTSQSLPGVWGQSNTGPGVSGQSIGQSGTGPGGVQVVHVPASDGVLGKGVNGVHGISTGPALTAAASTWTSATSGAGVLGENPLGDGVVGTGYNGVHGISTVRNSAGVLGENASGDGVAGSGYHGVHGSSSAAAGSGVWGENSSGGAGVSGTSTNGIGVHGTNTGTGFAGQFDGHLQVNGNHTVTGTATAQDVVLAGGDCAEQFDMHDAIAPEPGTIVVIDDEGRLQESQRAYDRRVAGVVSGAGEYRPAIVLDRRASSEGRASIALVGKVFCKVDADSAPIAVGDLLTTSTRPGFAMKAADPVQAFGAVIGKALKPFHAGQGMIPILVALQ